MVPAFHNNSICSPTTFVAEATVGGTEPGRGCGVTEMERVGGHRNRGLMVSDPTERQREGKAEEMPSTQHFSLW